MFEATRDYYKEHGEIARQYVTGDEVVLYNPEDMLKGFQSYIKIYDAYIVLI